MASVTRFQAACNASQGLAGEIPKLEGVRACRGCGRDFQITRPWQKHCSPRCRVRVYRQSLITFGYYGA